MFKKYKDKVQNENYIHFSKKSLLLHGDEKKRFLV